MKLYPEATAGPLLADWAAEVHPCDDPITFEIYWPAIELKLAHGSVELTFKKEYARLVAEALLAALDQQTPEPAPGPALN